MPLEKEIGNENLNDEMKDRLTYFIFPILLLSSNPSDCDDRYTTIIANWTVI